MKSHGRKICLVCVSLALVIAAGLCVAAGVSGQESSRARAGAAARAPQAPIPDGTYRIDPAHSSINFAVRHMMINDVRGRFTDFSGVIRYDGHDITRSSVEFTAKVASINTDVPRRDEHLRGADFFDAAKYPEMTFKSTRVGRGEGDRYVAHGDLTLRGVTKQVSIPFRLNGPVRDARGGTRFGVEAATSINRRDFGITFGNLIEGVGPVIADQVEITLLLEAVKQEKAQPSQE